MEDSVERIREELRKYEHFLENDFREFDQKLNLTRENLFDFIDRQMEYLTNMKEEYSKEFTYLDEENKKTCSDNRQQFDKLCLTINRNGQNLTLISKLWKDFEENFSLRPTMLKSIPQYNFKDLQKNELISSSPVKHTSSPIDNNQSAFIPIDDTEITSIPMGSIGSSHHKQFASQNNETSFEPQSRLVSTCSTINGHDNMLDMSFKIPYEYDRTPRLMCFNEDENSLLIYSLFSRQLEHLCLNTRKISPVDLPISEPVSNLGYSHKYHLFYLTTQQTCRFLLFRLNEQKLIEIDREIDLIDKKDHFIRLHIYENLIFFLYLSSSIVMFGKHDLEKSSSLPSISFQSKLYDADEKSSYAIIDFAINDSFISFLTRLNNNKNKFLIVIHDYDSMVKLHSFDLIDAIKPLSIITTEKKANTSATTMNNDQIELLLFVNDPKGHLIHCCTYQQYLIPIQVTASGICSLDDGNIALVASKDIRGLKVQDYLQEKQCFI